MTKKSVFVMLFVFVLLFAAGAVMADDPPPAPDGVPITEGAGDIDGASSFDSPGGDAEVGGSLIDNGAFDNWVNGSPSSWSLWRQDKAGWEEARPYEVDLAVADGTNNALGFFIRNVGGSGSYTAGAYQQLNRIPAPGYYFVNISEAIYEDRAAGGYNAVAWYAISEHQSASMVPSDAWRELDPYTRQCANDAGFCAYVGRDETVWIEPGDYFHIMVSQKWPYFNTWSLFVIDDISVVTADPNPETNPNVDNPNGYYDWLDWEEATTQDVDEKCHYYSEFCYPYYNTYIYVPN